MQRGQLLAHPTEEPVKDGQEAQVPLGWNAAAAVMVDDTQPALSAGDGGEGGGGLESGGDGNGGEGGGGGGEGSGG